MKKILISVLSLSALVGILLILKDIRPLVAAVTLDNQHQSTQDKISIIKQLFNYKGVMSQTDGHLQQNAEAAWNNVLAIANNPCYKAVFDAALDHERSVVKDSAVFYHAQRNSIYWPQLVYTKLWERKYNHRLNNYLFTRFPNEQSPEIIAAELKKGQADRHHVLAHGRQDHQHYTEMSPLLLPTNYALFANSKDHLACTAQYFMHDFNDLDPKISTRDIVAKFSTQDLYQKYAHEFELLEEQFKEIVPHSVILQLALPFDLLKEHVYLSTRGSWKTTIYINNSITGDIHTIVNTLKTDPAAFPESDEPIFRITVTPDAVHRLRERGAEIKVYGCFDKQKLNALIARLEALIDTIALENAHSFEGSLTVYKNEL